MPDLSGDRYSVWETWKVHLKHLIENHEQPLQKG